MARTVDRASIAVHASDVRLCTPRGLLATAVAGQRARLELAAPAGGGSARPELPGRLKCVLHLQSVWCEPAEGSLAGAEAGGLGEGATEQRKRATAGEGERFFRGRVAYAPHRRQQQQQISARPPG